MVRASQIFAANCCFLDGPLDFSNSENHSSTWRWSDFRSDMASERAGADFLRALDMTVSPFGWYAVRRSLRGADGAIHRPTAVTGVRICRCRVQTAGPLRFSVSSTTET